MEISRYKLGIKGYFSEEKMIACSVIRTRRYLARANRTLVVRVLEKGGKHSEEKSVKIEATEDNF
jgi:hypothetical protein